MGAHGGGAADKWIRKNLGGYELQPESRKDLGV